MLGLPNLNSTAKARLLSLTADVEFSRGLYDKAAGLHLAAAQLGIQDVYAWERPLIGHVLALLKKPDIEAARLMAYHTVAIAQNKMAVFDDAVRSANRRLEDEGSVAVPPLPPRPSVVATRLGNLFLLEGEPAIAQDLFEKALQINPRGASRARIGLARAALSHGDAGKALALAEDAIRRGRFRRKTLSGWPILIEARRRLGGWRIKERLIESLKVATPAIRAKAIVIIVQELRRHGMQQWVEIASEWLKREGAGYPIEAIELKKILLASEKEMPGRYAERLAKSEDLLSTEPLSRSEWLAAAKEQVLSGLMTGQTPDIPNLLSDAEKRFDAKFRIRAQYGLALTCLESGRRDMAKALLERGMKAPHSDPSLRAKLAWALARIEDMNGNHVASARIYQELWQNKDLPPRMALQARLLWARSLAQSGNVRALNNARSQIEDVLRIQNDYETLLNFARQMVALHPSLEEWSITLLDEGSRMAMVELARAETPGKAAEVLFKLTRRQIIDFGRVEQAIAYWEEMPSQRKAWLWSADRNYWQYVGLLALGYLRNDEREKARIWTYEILGDPSTPPEGVVQIATTYADWLITRGGVVEAFQLYDRVIKEAPSHELAIHAWYWNALAAHKQGRMDERNRRLAALKRAQGARVQLQGRREVETKAWLMYHDLDSHRARENVEPNYSAEELTVARSQLLRDMEILP